MISQYTKNLSCSWQLQASTQVSTTYPNESDSLKPTSKEKTSHFCEVTHSHGCPSHPSMRCLTAGQFCKSKSRFIRLPLRDKHKKVTLISFFSLWRTHNFKSSLQMVFFSGFRFKMPTWAWWVLLNTTCVTHQYQTFWVFTSKNYFSPEQKLWNYSFRLNCVFSDGIFLRKQ